MSREGLVDVRCRSITSGHIIPLDAPGPMLEAVVPFLRPPPE
jgi:hypothetical protein